MPTGNAPAETARVTHSLRFCQIGFAAKQGLLGAFALHYLSCQFLVDRRQLAGPFYDPLLKLLIQPVGFSLSLFVPSRLDNVPTPTPLRYRKLMGPHHIQDFSSSARREWISAKHRQALTGDSLIERLFVFTEVPPIFFFQPSRVSRDPYARITSCRCAREFLVPTVDYLVEIKRALLEIPVASRDNLYALLNEVSIKVGNS